jgi:protein PhnA
MNPTCPSCKSTQAYEDAGLWTCPDCGHEWSESTQAEAQDADSTLVVRDAYGNELKDGDTVTLIKDLKVKGSSSGLKVGTRVKGIRLVEGDHNIDCRIDGIGAMALKSEFVKKA